MHLLRRVPFTASVVLLIVVLAIATGTAWSPLERSDWYADVGFGPPALQDGRWWTVVTGSLFALQPLQYPVVLVFFALPVGLCEWRLGTRRTAAVVTIGQVLGVVLGGLLVIALSHTGWGWAQRTATDLDVGFSAGALAAATVVSADLRRPWRGRLRLAVFGYVITSLSFLGYLYDVEHLVAASIGLWVGPWIVGRQPSRTVAQWLRPGFTRRDLRMITGGYFLWGAILSVLGQVADRDGPFGPIGGDPESWWWILASVVVDLVIAWGLVRGRRTWWMLAVLLTLVSWTAGVATAVTIVAGGATNSGLLWVFVIIDTAQLAALVVGRSAFRNPGRRGLRRVGPDRIGAQPTEVDRDRARALLTRHGSPHRLAWMTTWPQNRWWFDGDDAVVAYHSAMGVTIGLCDPVGPDRLEVARRFIGAARDAGTTPCLFSCSAEVARWAQDEGWIAVQVAEEAIVDLPDLEFKGKKWQDVRSAFNQADKLGIETRMMRLADAPRGLRTQLRAISDEWVRDKGLPEMGFTLGGLAEAEDPAVWVNVAVDADMTVHGVTSWMPIAGPDGETRGYTLDLMRRLPGGFRYTMELLIASACREFQAQGLEVVSLSGAPLAHAGSGDSVVDRSVIDDVLARAGNVLEPYYGFQSLQAFKSKFQPRYEPLFLVAADETALPRIALAVGRAYLADATLGQLLALTRH